MRKRRAWLVAMLVGAIGLVLSLGVGNASAFSCSDAGDNDVLLVMNNETVTVTKGNQSRILANGSPCGNATASNTATIYVLGQGVNDTLIIDAGGGWFEPGVDDGGIETNGTTSRNEIEWILGDPAPTPFGASPENIVINGNAAADVINVGGGQVYAVSQDEDEDGVTLGDQLGDAAADEIGFINLNGDDDADVFFADEQEGDFDDGDDPEIDVTVNGKGGNDFISAKGGLGTGETTGIDTVTDVGGSVEGLLGGIVINGGDGDDSIQGGDGDDIISGGAGNDVIDGDDDGGHTCHTDDDSETSSEPIDIHVDDGDTVTYAGATGPITADLDPSEGHPGTATGEGTDVLQNIENLIGSPGNDTLSGDNGDNTIQGGPGDDTLAGDAGDDCVFGQDGNDTLDENEGTTTAQGGNGVTNGADILVGGTPQNIGDDDDSDHFNVITDTGLDDVVTYSSRTTRVNVYLEAFSNVANNNAPSRKTLGDGGDAQYNCADDHDSSEAIADSTPLPLDGADLDGDGLSGDDEGDCIWLDVENAIGGSGNDTLFASFVNNRADNEFTGNGGNDRMAGGAGNDTFHEGSAASGADVMDGGTGTDTADYAGRSNALDVSLDGADNDGEAGEGDNVGGVFTLPVSASFNDHGYLNPESQPTSTVNVENVQGGSGNDVLNGSDQQNVLNGNAGNDSITGAGGQDVLNGGDGDDWVAGGLGNDAMNGGNGTDTVDYASAGAGGVGVNINLATGQASGDGNDTLAGFENASGSSFADSVQGDAGNNVLNGRGGNDAIQGADGDDKVNGGSGNDELGGGAGNDRIDGGNGSDAIRGGAGDDNLSGGPADDTLIGGDGNDVLSGGVGKDVHRGGPGTDRCNPGTPGLAAGDTAAGCES